MWFGNMTWCDVMDGWLGVCACSVWGGRWKRPRSLLPPFADPRFAVHTHSPPSYARCHTCWGHTRKCRVATRALPPRPSPTPLTHSHSRAVTLTDGRMARRQTRKSCSSGGRPIGHHTSLCGLTRGFSRGSKIKAVWPRLSRERDPTSTRRGSQTRVRHRLLTTFGTPMLRRVARKHPRRRRPLLG